MKKTQNAIGRVFFGAGRGADTETSYINAHRAAYDIRDNFPGQDEAGIRAYFPRGIFDMLP